MIAGFVLAGASCTRSSGSQEKFCAALPRTGDLLSLLSRLDPSDPEGTAQRFERGAEKFRELEKAAPREIRADVADVGDAYQKVLDAVKAHPDDLPAVRRDLADDSATFAAAARSALRMADYAKRECGIDLIGGITSSTTLPTTAPGATGPPGT